MAHLPTVSESCRLAEFLPNDRADGNACLFLGDHHPAPARGLVGRTTNSLFGLSENLVRMAVRPWAKTTHNTFLIAELQNVCHFCQPILFESSKLCFNNSSRKKFFFLNKNKQVLSSFCNSVSSTTSSSTISSLQAFL